MSEKCSKCGKEISMWKANYVGNKIFCNECHKKIEEPILQKEKLEIKRIREEEKEIKELKRKDIFYTWLRLILFITIFILFVLLPSMGREMSITTKLGGIVFIILIGYEIRDIYLYYMYCKK